MVIALYVMLTVVAVAVVLPLAYRVLKRPSTQRIVEYKASNLAILKSQLKELRLEKETGDLSERDYEQAHSELQRRVLDETEHLQSENWGEAVGARKLAVTLAVIVPVLSLGLYTYWGSPQMVEPELVANSMAAEQPVDVAEMVVRLEQRLQKNPDDPASWLMMARVHSYYERHDEAVGAYAKAMPVVDNDPVALAQYAEAILLSGKDELQGLPKSLVDRALYLDPGEPLALMLGGAIAYQEQEYDTTIFYWETLLSKYPADSPAAQQISEELKAVRALRHEARQ